MSSTRRSARRRRTIARPTKYTMSAVAGGHSTATHGSVVCSAVAGSGSTSTRQRRVRDSKPSLAAGVTSSPPSRRCPSRWMASRRMSSVSARPSQPEGTNRARKPLLPAPWPKRAPWTRKNPRRPTSVVIGVAVPANTEVGSRSVTASACTSETSVPVGSRCPLAAARRRRRWPPGTPRTRRAAPGQRPDRAADPAFVRSAVPGLDPLDPERRGQRDGGRRVALERREAPAVGNRLVVERAAESDGERACAIERDTYLPRRELGAALRGAVAVGVDRPRRRDAADDAQRGDDGQRHAMRAALARRSQPRCAVVIEPIMLPPNARFRCPG